MAEQDLLPGDRVQLNSSQVRLCWGLHLAVLCYKSPWQVSIHPCPLEVFPDRNQMATAVSFGWSLYIMQYCLYGVQECHIWVGAMDMWATSFTQATFPSALLHPHFLLIMEHCHTGLTLCLGRSQYLASWWKKSPQNNLIIHYLLMDMYLVLFIWVKTLIIKYFKTHFISPILGLYVL